MGGNPQLEDAGSPCGDRERAARKEVRMAGIRMMACASLTALLATPALAAAPDIMSLAGYVRTFSEEFDSRLSVSSRGPGTRWIAHTPWNGDFGEAAFADPEPGFPFKVAGGVLRIEMRRDATGKWRSGLLSSVDVNGGGFAQRYGYFEMLAKLPAGPGVWPAFWLIGTDRTLASPEIDVLEHYGSMPDRFYSHIHTWDKVVPSQSLSVNSRNMVAPGQLSSSFNTYGVLITAETTAIYFNRAKVWETPTQPAHHQPMMVLLNLAAGGGYPIEGMKSPSYMHVGYVRVWRARL